MVEGDRSLASKHHNTGGMETSVGVHHGAVVTNVGGSNDDRQPRISRRSTVSNTEHSQDSDY